MARIKKTDTVPPPKDPRTVKKGCISCIHYKLTMKEFPCNQCVGWNYWTDSGAGSNQDKQKSQL